MTNQEKDSLAYDVGSIDDELIFLKSQEWLENEEAERITELNRQKRNLLRRVQK